MTFSAIEKIRQSLPLKKFIEKLAIVLTGCYGLSLLARFHWFADLFSHFTFQYIIGAIVILTGLIFVRHWKAAAVIALVLCANGFEYGRHLNLALSPSAFSQGSFTIAHYNRYVGARDHSAVIEWLTSNAEKFDIVVLQEAHPTLSTDTKALNNLYPHQIHEPRQHAFGTIILSRHPFLESEPVSFIGQPFDNFAARLVVKPPQFKDTVTIYPLHAVPPMKAAPWAQRNYELKTVATRIAADNSPHRIMIGDWNITPYSPFFADTLKISGLRWQDMQPFPSPTWPVQFVPWLMQIKIDHILSDNSLELVDATRRNLPYSDHYAITATFTEK
ncbi:MAG: endonuclease/exonuclease/phosphatase family protein [Alphaproteobacteria bacterium]|nr:endonuclease/exonuclease/phosphatase family protein [Alphaproteobacteria bacterium]